MAKFGPSDIVINVDNSGGTPVDMTQFIDEQSVLDIEGIIEEAHSFGDSFAEHLFTGIKRAGGITFGGFYDDTSSTGPDAVFNAQGDTRTVAITWGSTNITSFEAIITNYTRTPGRNASTRYSVTFMPTGTISEA